MNNIGKRLRQERKRLKLTQSALAAIGGVEANAQGHYESGQRLPRADYLFRVAAAGVDISRVVTGIDTKNRMDMPTLPKLAGSDIDNELGNADSVVKIISQLRQSLWVTANALCEVTRLIDAKTQEQTSLDHVEDHLRVLQGDADMFVALALSKVHKASHDTP